MILEQTKPAATVHVRVGDAWVVEVLIGDASLDLPEIEAALPLTELYEGVEFPTEMPTTT